MYALIELTIDIKLAIPQKFRNNHWSAGTRFLVKQEKPEWGMIVYGSHPDAGIGIPPGAAKIIQVFDSYLEMINAQKEEQPT